MSEIEDRIKKVRSLYACPDKPFVKCVEQVIIDYVEYAAEAIDSMTLEELNEDYEDFLSK